MDLGKDCSNIAYIRGWSDIPSGAKARCNPNSASCTVSSRTARTDIRARNPNRNSDRTCSLRRPGNSPPYCRRARTIRRTLRSSRRPAARISLSIHDTVHNTADYTDCSTTVRSSDPWFGSRRHTTTRAQARETCDSSFPPNDRRSPRAREEESGCAQAGTVDITGIGGITGRIQQFSGRLQDRGTRDRVRIRLSFPVPRILHPASSAITVRSWTPPPDLLQPATTQYLPSQRCQQNRRSFDPCTISNAH